MTRVVVCRELGLPDKLVVEDRPRQDLGPHQARVTVKAAGVNFVDGLMIQGLYQIKPPLPFVPGSEIAGVVTDVSDDVDSVKPGDRVITQAGLGAFTDELVVHARQLTTIPDNLTDGQAATFGQSYMTGWFALKQRARATAGQSMLVLGAGGGVGLAAIDIGKALGLRVIAAASSQAKRDAATNAGADATIDSTTEDVKTRAREFGGGGVDLVYDPVGGDLAEQGLRALGNDGQLLVIGFASGTIPKLPANQVLLRNRRVTGVEWGGWALTHPEENAQLTQELLASIGRNELQPIEPTTYPLDQAARALDDLINRRVTGKLALIP